MKVLETGQAEPIKSDFCALEPGNMIVYQLLDEPNAVAQPSESRPHVFASNGSICVKGGEASVYTLGGELVGHTSNVLPVSSGFYVVKTSYSSRKIYVR